MVIIGYDGAELLDIACPADVFDTAAWFGARPGYRVEFVSLGGRPVRCSNGLALAAAPLEAVRGPLDTVLAAGGLGHTGAAADARVLTHLRRLAGLSRRVASVCTGATLLAAAGLLDGRRATTHWMFAAELAQRYPAVEVDPAPLYVRDGNVLTSAGVTSALDLSLAMVEDDHGPELSRAVARSLVTYLQRPGNQAQVSMFLAAPPPEHETVRKVMAHIADRPGDDLGSAALARLAGVSARHLTRLFRDQLGTTPARHVRAVRAETAAHLLVSTRLPLDAVARRCGFGCTETLRQAFAERYATSPSAYRRAHRASAGTLRAAG
ncbi:GlxA family transcriptional regulator [Actinomadura craniellae]|uniref:GlxA family transcriptional regulator n=1 Tax=Actinomadura craniellae TaxID=2231787 RepID=A0A365H083_9ACTN|nr:DJ-1/PfpI family protein [Actinomadura craniellae]RAY12428.1 GlxA family transcriptional regulator [Actinomadura craniellae]